MDAKYVHTKVICRIRPKLQGRQGEIVQVNLILKAVLKPYAKYKTDSEHSNAMHFSPKSNDRA